MVFRKLVVSNHLAYGLIDACPIEYVDSAIIQAEFTNELAVKSEARTAF
jgi:hypothetical protein